MYRKVQANTANFTCKESVGRILSGSCQLLLRVNPSGRCHEPGGEEGSIGNEARWLIVND